LPLLDYRNKYSAYNDVGVCLETSAKKKRLIGAFVPFSMVALILLMTQNFSTNIRDKNHAFSV